MRSVLVACLTVSFVLAPLAVRAEAPPCRPDEALAEAAAQLLLDGGHPDGDRVLVALRAAGSDLPSAHALTLRGGDADRAREARWLRSLRKRTDAPLVCGEATEGGLRLVLAAPRAGRLDPAPGGVRVRVDPAFDHAYLALRDAAGTYRRLAFDEGGGELVSLPADLERPVLVQLVATGRAGPRPVAVRRLGADPVNARAGEEGAAQAEHLPPGPVRERLAELRALHGVGSLRANRLMDRAAADHARAVCASHRVAHALTPGGDPEARLARHGLAAQIVGEVVARAHDLDEAFDALVASPSHQLTMIDRRFTDVGLGRATDHSGHTCLVALFAAWPRYQP